MILIRDWLFYKDLKLLFRWWDLYSWLCNILNVTISFVCILRLFCRFCISLSNSRSFTSFYFYLFCRKTWRRTDPESWILNWSLMREQFSWRIWSTWLILWRFVLIHQIHFSGFYSNQSVCLNKLCLRELHVKQN